MTTKPLLEAQAVAAAVDAYRRGIGDQDVRFVMSGRPAVDHLPKLIDSAARVAEHTQRVGAPATSNTTLPEAPTGARQIGMWVDGKLTAVYADDDLPATVTLHTGTMLRPSNRRTVTVGLVDHQEPAGPQEVTS